MEENVTVVPHFPTGKREIVMLVAIAAACVLLANCFLYGGANLGFAVTVSAVILISHLYFHRHRKTGLYAKLLGLLSLVIAASFLRSDDDLVKFVMVCFLLVAGNLSLVIGAGQNRRSPNGLLSLLDAGMGLFYFGIGELPKSFAGLNAARKNAGSAGKKNVAVLTGLLIAIPVVAILIPLLISADAAFAGLLQLLPELDVGQLLVSLMFGLPLGIVLYTRNTALKHGDIRQAASWQPRQVNALTVNTVLTAVCAVYLAYLASQLAYFAGGFSGILPEEYTMAEYARRGFFEMAWICAINLAIIALAAALAEHTDGRLRLSTRLLCLFVGIVTLFLTATASAKMFMYIDSFGLTRLRLLVQVIIIFLALTVVFVLIWLFRPRFAYMKAVLLSALVIGAAVSWADVDTVVAAYNVGAYQAGKLDKVDIAYLSELGDGVVPYLQELTNEKNLSVRQQATAALTRRASYREDDIRAWNIAAGKANAILKEYAEPEVKEDIAPNIVVHQSAMDDAAIQLIQYRAETQWAEEYLVLYVKDLSLFDEEGNVLLPILAYDVCYALDCDSITTIWIADSYVLFWSGKNENACIAWMEDPDITMSRLWQLYPQMEVWKLRDEWYQLEVAQ